MTISLTKRLALGHPCLGAWLTVAHPVLAEAMASLGFHWLAVDMEHGPVAETEVQAVFAACALHGAAPMVRLPAADPHLARRMLDLGAAGLLIPVVEDAAVFAEFAAHCLYPPAGRRGVGLSRANLWGDGFDGYLNGFRPVLAPQIETRAGVAAADVLAALDGVAGLFLGPYDLSASLGRPGDFESSVFRAAAEEVRAACARHGKALGIHQVTPDSEQLRRRIDEGYRFIAYGTDVIALRHALRLPEELT